MSLDAIKICLAATMWTSALAVPIELTGPLMGAPVEGFTSKFEPIMSLETATRVKRASSWESVLLSEVCKDDSSENYNLANKAVSALKKHDNDYAWLVYLANAADGWASQSQTQVWKNTCGKDIVVWRVNKRYAGSGCSSELRERAELIIYKETSGSNAGARDNINTRLNNAGISHDGIIVYSSNGSGTRAARLELDCFVETEENGKHILVHLDN
eukprot:GFUD01055366.1.p1 GENE.GFUD01055366.1~~GFUD01055366.1.p1  ORF type:complete len:215 (+),score=49.17 GFUD01055366.1:3-647(+)